MYREVGVIRPEIGTTRFFITIGEGGKNLFFNQEDLEEMMRGDGRAEMYQMYMSKPHTVGYMTMHQSGDRFVVHYNHERYYIHYTRFIRCLHGALKSVVVMESIPDVELPWQSILTTNGVRV